VIARHALQRYLESPLYRGAAPTLILEARPDSDA
jgi:hypothetical protein